jgi:hypothetical protein
MLPREDWFGEMVSRPLPRSFQHENLKGLSILLFALLPFTVWEGIIKV